MIGFDYRSIVLQVIHGSLIVVTIVFLYADHFEKEIKFLTENEVFASVIFLFISYAIGILIDMLSDLFESFIVKYLTNLPFYHLLTRDRWFGISLAHREHIRNGLCNAAAHFKSSDPAERDKMSSDYHTLFDANNKKPDKKMLNYILQVAKNYAFRKCQVYQKEQINSFFMLYIFSRNLSLGLLIASMLFLSHCHFIIATVLLLVCVFSIIACYRYYLYYARILLGTALHIDKMISDKKQNSESRKLKKYLMP
jgi:hypothetical protein